MHSLELGLNVRVVGKQTEECLEKGGEKKREKRELLWVKHGMTAAHVQASPHKRTGQVSAPAIEATASRMENAILDEVFGL